MAGISSKALKPNYAENKKKFNDGTELNSDFEIGWYETDYRIFDPQIGRFHQVDLLGELSSGLSVYTFASNNPILRNDPSGLKDTTVNGESANTAPPLETVNVTGRKKSSSSVGQPELLESIIPVWGSGRAAVDDFQNGRWGWGLFNTAMAVTDIFLVKTIVTASGKLVVKGLEKISEEIIRINTERITLATLRNLTRESLLNSVTNPKLKSMIENLYRKGAKIGSGSTADVIRTVGDAGHIEKGGNRINGLRNLINSGELSGQDLDIAKELMDDLIDAIGSLK